MLKLKKYFKDFQLDILLIFFVVFLISFSNYIWLLHEKIPPHWDMARHLYISLLYLNSLHLNSFHQLWDNYCYYPPLRYWLTIPFYLVFGNSSTVAIMSNVVFIGVLAFSVYEIGKILWGRSTGLLAMLGILCSPMFVGQFKEYQLDAQLSAMVALSLCLLIKTKEFSERKYSIWFGVSLGLGMLTKWTFICCLFLPSLYSVIKGVLGIKPNRKRVIENILLAACVGIIISLVWYNAHISNLRRDFSGNGIKSSDDSLLSLTSLSWYLVRFEWIQMYFFPTVLFVVGILLVFLKKEWFEKNRYPFLLVFGSYLSLDLLHHDCRYTMPMLVGAFMFAVYWFDCVKPKSLRVVLKTFFVLYCCFTFAVISMGTNLFPTHVEVAHIVLFDQSGYGVSGPDSTDWHQEDAFKIISDDKNSVKEMAWDEPTPDEIRLNPIGYHQNRFNDGGIFYYALKYNVVLKELKDQPEYVLKRTFEKRKDYLGYRIYRQFVLPDHSFLYLFKKKTV